MRQTFTEKRSGAWMSDYRADIDGLRAVAVISVVAFHAFPRAVPGGFTGVDVFFVISGFLISRIILDEIEAQTFSLRRFYERRIQRIVPALSCVLLGCLIAGWIALLPDEYAQLGKHVLTGSAFASNIQLWREAGYFDVAAARKPLLHLWSLGIEEQFYLFWPGCLLLLHRLSRSIASAIAALAVLSFAVNVLAVSGHAIGVFYLPVTRLWELLLGYAALRFLRLGSSPGLCNIYAGVGAVLVAGSTFLLDGTAAYPSWRAVFPTIGTALLIVAGGKAWINNGVLSSRPMVLVGLISYPLYLWHWPLLSFARIVARPSPEVNLALSAISVLLAWLTWRYVEVGVRRNRDPRTALRLVGVLVAISLCGALIIETSGAEFRHGFGTSWPALRDIVSTFPGVPCEVPHADLDLCAQSRPGPVNAVVVGDSHAQKMFAGLASDPNRNWLLLGNLSCPPVLGVVVENPDRRDCSEKMPRVSEYLRDPSSPSIVLLAFYGYYGESDDFAADHLENGSGPSHYRFESVTLQSKRKAFATGLSNMIGFLLGHRKSVYLMIDVPELSVLPRDCIRREAWGLGECVLSRDAIEARQSGLRSIVSELVESWPALRVFDPLPVMCGMGDCFPVRKDFSYYSDSHHLSVRGSQRVARPLLAFLDAR